jgi:hypothetical protein
VQLSQLFSESSLFLSFSAVILVNRPRQKPPTQSELDKIINIVSTDSGQQKEDSGPTVQDKNLSLQPEVKQENTEQSTPKPIQEQPKSEAVKTQSETATSKYLAKWFYDKTGQTHWDICNSKEVGRKFVQAFAEFGQDAQVIACVTLNYENGQVGGDYITDAISPCWSTNAAQAKARKCSYASDNSAGVDAGLFMINTFYQAKRITKLGGPACNFTDSRNPKDECNIQKISWLHNLDNQIDIIKDIHMEQGFNPWVAYKKHVAPYV